MKKSFLFFTCLILLGSTVYSQSTQGIEPLAGTWKTWVIPSGKAFTVPPPPQGDAAKAEIKEMIELQKNLDSAAMVNIHNWNKGTPAYQWQDIPASFLELDTTQNFARVYALVNVAIYDATIAAWNAKYAYNRERPSGNVKRYAATPNSPSYPCEYSVTAAAAATMLAYFFPAKADSIMQMAKQAGLSRIQAGVQYPSDVKAGFDLGVKVAEYIIEQRAKTDGWDKKWEGKIPEGPRYWKGKPLRKDIPNAQPWVLTSGSQFHSVPPPDEATDMAELNAFTRSSASNYRALKWQYEWPWGTLIDSKIMEYGLANNPPAVARIYTLLAVADYDQQIANIESKYTYFRIRPDQYDTTFVTVFKTPPSPCYPAGHATVASCYATVLSYLFPYDALYFEELANEEAESRFEGGVHYHSDNKAGLEMGRKVGEEIIKWAKKDGSDKRF